MGCIGGNLAKNGWYLEQFPSHGLGSFQYIKRLASKNPIIINKNQGFEITQICMSKNEKMAKLGFEIVAEKFKSWV